MTVIGSSGVGRVTVTREGIAPGEEPDLLQINDLLKGNNTADRFAALVRHSARAAVSYT